MSASADEPRSTCSKCGARLQRGEHLANQCPICLLDLAWEEDPTKSQECFHHYRVATHPDGTPDELGRGAMGITYRASDTVLRYHVALKVIDASIAAHTEARERFLREARAAARLRHPNVASVFYFGVRESDGQCFYAMELVEGETLEARLRRTGPLSPTAALEVISQVAKALVAAEALGLMHRDLKPANLMLTEGPELTVKVIDFGLAKAVASARSEIDLTQGGFVGTPAFASPEQFTGRVDVRSDLYSLGITLWAMLTGEVPFRGTPAEVMYQHQHAPLPVERLKYVPQPVVVLLEILLDKDPAERFRVPNELLTVIPAVMRAVKARRTIEHKRLRADSVQRLGSSSKKLAAIRVPKRSIAVLPFASLSNDKRNAYFADGVQDEILSNLAKVSQLKVISRTSVMTYRSNNNRDLRSIANALGVANVVEGTVRKDGNRIRITIRLVDARRDKALWSESYDRDLTDIFAIQSDIAKTVAAILSAHLSTHERKEIEEIPTNNLEAYDLYLQAKELFASPPGIRIVDEHDDLLKAVDLLEEATRKDPQFALAYCLLARAQGDLYRLDRNEKQREFADSAINQALRLRPDLPEVHLAMAFHLLKCYRNYERARVQIAIAENGLPNSPTALACTAYIDRREARMEESTRCLERALSLDPRNPEFIKQLAINYICLRRNPDFERTYDQVITLRPEEKPLLMLEKAFLTILTKADLTSFRAALKGLSVSMKRDSRTASWCFAYAILARDWTMAREVLSDNGNEELYFSKSDALVPRGCLEIWLAQAEGAFYKKLSDFVAARDQLHRKVERYPEDAGLLSALGLIDGALGRAQEAIKEARGAAEMVPISEDGWERGPGFLYNLAAVYALNEPSLAFEQLAILVKTQGGLFYGQLKLDPALDSLRADPRFDQLVKQLDPKE